MRQTWRWDAEYRRPCLSYGRNAMTSRICSVTRWRYGEGGRTSSRGGRWTRATTWLKRYRKRLLPSWSRSFSERESQAIADASETMPLQTQLEPHGRRIQLNAPSVRDGVDDA